MVITMDSLLEEVSSLKLNVKDLAISLTENIKDKKYAILNDLISLNLKYMDLLNSIDNNDVILLNNRVERVENNVTELRNIVNDVSVNSSLIAYIDNSLENFADYVDNNIHNIYSRTDDISNNITKHVNEVLMDNKIQQAIVCEEIQKSIEEVNTSIVNYIDNSLKDFIKKDDDMITDYIDNNFVQNN